MDNLSAVVEAMNICLQDLTPEQNRKLRQLSIQQDMNSITIEKVMEIVETIGLDINKLQRIAESRAKSKSIEPKKSTKIPVNSPCPCGSGLKYKKCCSKVDPSMGN